MKHVLLRGALFLTFAGLFSRIMGFFYRIFLANTIGAEGLGIYQMIFPIYGICFSLCASGIETALSKLVASKCALGKNREAFGILKTGIFITLFLAFGCSFLIYHYADIISNIFLKEPRCSTLLKYLALTIPLGTTQSCICGYYFGVHKAAVPSIAQLIEQTIRIGCVFWLYHIYEANQIPLSPIVAVLGLLAGELFCLLFTVTCFSFHCKEKYHLKPSAFYNFSKEILPLSLPLTSSRICISLLASLEATLLPNALKAYGFDTSTALSIYGILTGMALPLILFPNALTSSISLMLLPAVSESQTSKQFQTLRKTMKLSFLFCIALGCGCLFFFLILGKFLGSFLFESELAGNFITTLSWICPFLYLNTTLTSVLNGLGKTSTTFFIGTAGLFLRIGFLFLIVPKIGIQGYLYGLLASQLFITFFGGYCIHHFTKEFT